MRAKHTNAVQARGIEHVKDEGKAEDGSVSLDGGSSDMPGYGDGAQYWDKKHVQDENPYEWMQGYEDLSGLVARCTGGNRKHRVLHVGCGSSLLTEEMYDDGYQDRP